jgi:hypothetical protein
MGLVNPPRFAKTSDLVSPMLIGISEMVGLCTFLIASG